MSDHLPFGRESRVRILKKHLSLTSPISAENAWRFIYRELLWIDGSTGLAHLYESDKAQPGRPWYGRSVIFTDLLCEEFGNVTRAQLGREIDQLFRASLQELVEPPSGRSNLDPLNQAAVNLLGSAGASKTTNPGILDVQDGTPVYTPDAELVEEFATLLVERGELPQFRALALARVLVARARLYYTVERKRQNVLGEGFEDLLQLLLIEVGQVPEDLIVVRSRANKLPGFQTPSSRDRIEAPDVAFVQGNETKLLASVKWSLRHDRQKQLSDELDCYVDLLSQESFPRYVLVTNEYDPGRLVNADGLARRGQAIDCIYHTNLALLLRVLDDHPRIKDLRPLVAKGRLRSVADLFEEFRQGFPPSDIAAHPKNS